MRIILGELATSRRVRRIRLAPLSLAAVTRSPSRTPSTQRSSTEDGGQPFLRHRGHSRSGGRDPPAAAGRSPCTRGPSQRPARRAARGGASSRRRQSCGCWQALAGTKSAAWRSAWRRACSVSSAPEWRFGTSSPGSPSTSRWRRTGDSSCTAARSRLSAGRRTEVQTRGLAHHADAAGDAAAVLASRLRLPRWRRPSAPTAKRRPSTPAHSASVRSSRRPPCRAVGQRRPATSQTSTTPGSLRSRRRSGLP